MAVDTRSTIESLCSLYQLAFSDLRFLEPGSSALTIPVDRERVAFVRCELPGRQFLHLHSLEFFDPAGEQIKPIRGTAVSASSHHGISARVVGLRKLFAPCGSHLWGVHTKKDSIPWLQVSFPEPVELGSVILRNRGDQYSHRASGLKLLVSDDGKNWRTAFDAGARAAAFRAAAAAMVWTQDADHRLEATEVGSIATHMLLSEYPAARAKFSASALTADVKRNLQKAASELILFDRELEWTSHGAKRSFRFWGAHEKAAYVDFAASLVDELHRLSGDACFGFGSVLAVVRDQDLVKHDDDLDIIVGFERDRAPTLSVALRLTREFLEQAGYKVAGNFLSHWHVTRGGGAKVDVFVGIFESGDRIGWFPGARAGLKREDVFPPVIRPLLGRDCQIPRDPESYLAVVYGEDWRTPLPGWSHNWDRDSYKGIA